VRLLTIGVIVMSFATGCLGLRPSTRTSECVKEALATLLPPVSLGRIHSAGPACATAIVICPAMRNVTGTPRVTPRIRVDLFNQLNAGKRIDLDAQCTSSGEPEL